MAEGCTAPIALAKSSGMRPRFTVNFADAINRNLTCGHPFSTTYAKVQARWTVDPPACKLPALQRSAGTAAPKLPFPA
eukprot:662591-Pelagomonas_calceolata.AAC.4